MDDGKGNFGGLSRREFLYLSGIGMAGMTLSQPSRMACSSKREKAKTWRPIALRRPLGLGRTGCSQESRFC